MTAPLVLRPALPRERGSIDALLRGAGLRSEGEQLPIEAFVVAQAGASIVGSIALEARGDAGLLRSLAVDPAWRGRGIGDRLVEHLLAIAAQRDLAKLWLLTTTAAAFFARWGFAKTPRDTAPAAIAAHPQFAAECPASSTCMVRSLVGAVRAYPAGSLELRPDVAGAQYFAVAAEHCELTWYEVEPGVRFPRHAHEVDQITLVLDGELVFEVDGRPPIRLGPGEAVAVPAGVPHAVTAGAASVRAVDAWSRSPQSARDLAPARADVAVDMAVHHALVRALIDTGRVPPKADLATRLGIAPGELERALHQLARSHSLVLHPHAPEPWLVHPFSTSPTHTWIARGNDGWWAPCLWCGLGVAALVGGDVVVHTRLGGEATPIAIPVTDGRPRSGAPALCVHFPAPPRTAWDNVHHFCARLLPFRNGDEVEAWCVRHGLPRGEVLALDQLADLACRWYGGHARPDWRKWTMAEAAAIFRDAGLTGGFWQLESRDGSF